MEPYVVAITSFLGGSLTTAVVFMFAFVNRLAKVETKLDTLSSQVNNLTTYPCPMHEEFTKRVDRMDARVDMIRHGGTDAKRS